jgi:hypothetical protein
MNTLLALGWLPVFIMFLGLLALGRALEHRERLAMSARGITPPDTRRTTLPKPPLLRRMGALQGGVMTALGGLTLTLGLSPIGCIVPPALAGSSHPGPWLLASLIPLAVGSALIMGHYLTPGRPGEIPPGAGTDHPDERTSRSQERAAASQPASERGAPRRLPDPGRNGAPEPERTPRARYLQQERHDGVLRAFRPNAPVMVREGIAPHRRELREVTIPHKPCL